MMKRYFFIPIFILIVYFLLSPRQPKKEVGPVAMLYYQPLLKDQGKIVWDEVFKTMERCHMNQLILQWSRHGVVDFMREETWLQTILEHADKYQIEVIVGLYGDNNYFKVIEKSKLNLSDYFQSLHEISFKQAQKVYQVAKKYKSFGGWYLTEEIDDLNFQSRDRKKNLKTYLQNMASSLDNIASRPLYVSGFYSKQMNPQEYTEMFMEITQNKYHILLQSGVGANLVNLEESQRYIDIFSQHFSNKCIPVLEAFVIDANKSIHPMEFNALNRQIELVQKYNRGEKLALFSLRYFLDDTLLHQYQDHYGY